MENVFRGTVLALCSTILFACGDRSGKDVVQDVENSIADSDLMGSWVSECRDSELLNMAERQVMNFDGNQLTYLRHFYDEDNCESEALTLEYKGDFSIENQEDTNPADAKAIDLTYDEVFVTVHTDGGEDILETVNFCGQSEWTVGEEKNLTGESSEGLCPLTDLPMTKYDIYDVNNDQLHFGTQPGTDGPSTAEDRPREINQDISLTREN